VIFLNPAFLISLITMAVSEGWLNSARIDSDVQLPGARGRLLGERQGGQLRKPQTNQFLLRATPSPSASDIACASSLRMRISLRISEWIAVFLSVFGTDYAYWNIEYWHLIFNINAICSMLKVFEHWIFLELRLKYGLEARLSHLTIYIHVIENSTFEFCTPSRATATSYY